ncbi:MAG: hypothetical protein WD824_17610 [Cyclobacteriaceae bacterium]
MNSNGEFEPYLRIVEKEIGGDLLDYNETSNRFINDDLFKEYTGPHFRALADFAKQNKLSFKRKTDIIRILDEYERIVDLDSSD